MSSFAIISLIKSDLVVTKRILIVNCMSFDLVLCVSSTLCHGLFCSVCLWHIIFLEWNGVWDRDGSFHAILESRAEIWYQ